MIDSLLPTLARLRFAALIALQSLALGPASADDWPQFRGPTGQGIATGSAPSSWSEEQNITWKTEIPGKGWSSPVIWGDQIWVTTATADEASEAEKQRQIAASTAEQPLDVVDNLVMFAVCLDRRTGETLHHIPLMRKSHPEPIHTLNSFASPTPIVEQGRVYCHFGSNGTACVDTNAGKVLWTNQQIQVKTENGAGSTPVLWNDLVIVHFDGSDRQFIAAMHKDTGNIVWKTARTGEMHEHPQLRKSYGTPLIVDVDGRQIVMSPAANWLYAYDPANGEELWKLSYEGLGFSIAPRPVAKDGVLYFCTSFISSKLLAVRYAREGHAVEPTIVWQYKSQVSQMPSPLLVEDLLYFVADKGGIVTCVDADSGERVWRERLGGNYSASPVYADGRIYFFSREGMTHVIQPGREYQHLGENKLNGSFMASAAVVDEAIYVRTDQAVYRID